MKKAFKKAISILLVGIMVFGAAPLAGFVGFDLPELNLFNKKAEATTKGYCGDNLVWSLDLSTGEFIVSGTGEMDYWSHRQYVPWYNDKSYIKSVEINEGVTSISGSAFDGCTNLTSISIPDSLTSISSYDLRFCVNLTNITVGKNNDCYSTDENGVLYDKNKTTLIKYPAGNSNTSYIIPNSVKYIHSYAFYECNNLTSVYYSGTLEDWKLVDDGAYNYSLIKNLILEYNSERPYYGGNLGEDLAWKMYTDASELVISGTGAMPDFDYCGSPWYSKASNIKTVTIEDGVTRISDGAFDGCRNVENISIPVSIISIYDIILCDLYYPGTYTQWKSIYFESDETYITNYDYVIFECNSERPYHKGTCGNGIYWNFYPDNGELVISGNGSMTDYNMNFDSYGYSQPPWSRLEIKKITISKGVTSIGAYAFYDSNSLESVSISNSVTSIGSYAFVSCDNLEEVIISDNIKSINYSSFANCDSLVSITIPDSITSISDYAFNSCDVLSTVYYPGTPEQWEKITVGTNNTDLTDHIVFECDSEEPYFGKGTLGRNLTWFLDANGELEISSVGESQRWPSEMPWNSLRANIKTVKINEGVKSIGDAAFYDCSNLTEITIPDSVTYISYDVFDKCESIERINVSENNVSYMNDEYGVLYNKNKTSMVCYPAGSKNSSYTIPDSVTSFKFNNCDNLISVTVGNGVYHIGDYAFSNCDNLAEIIICDNVKTINSWAFSNCGSLTNFTVSKNNVSYSNDEYGVLFNKDKTTLVHYPAGKTSYTIPDSVTNIGNYAFYFHDNVANISYPGSYEQWQNDVTVGESNDNLINNLIFECNSERPYYFGAYGTDVTWKMYVDDTELIIDGTGEMSTDAPSVSAPRYNLCSKIEKVTIGNGVTNISPGTFGAECYDNLTEVKIGTGVTYIGNQAFQDCTSLERLVIPDGVTSIGWRAFYGCENLKEVTIPDSVTSIGNEVFAYCDSLERVYYSGTYEQWQNNVTVGTDYNEILISHLVFECNSERPYFTGVYDENFTWKLYVDGEFIISGAGEMTDFSSYSYVPWSEIDLVIKTATIENGITNIPNYMFSGCSNLSEVTISDTVVKIGDDAFYNCKSLTKITIPGGVTYMGGFAFDGCSNLESVRIPDGITQVSGYMFSGCVSLKSVEIPDSVTSIGYSAFYNCSSLENIIIPDGVTNIGEYAFEGCTALENVTIGSNIRTISKNAFYNCNNIANAYYVGTLKQWENVNVESKYSNEKLIENLVFECNSEKPYYGYGSCGYELTWKHYADGELVISGTGNMYNWDPSKFSPDYSPWYDSRLKINKITINEGVTAIGDYAFYCCHNATDISIPDSVTSISREAFIHSPLYDDPSNWENGVLYIDKCLIDVKISVSGEYSIKEGTKIIADHAFACCSNLTNVAIPQSVTSIGNEAFANCFGITDIIIPESVTHIGWRAFYECKNLATAYYPGSYEQWNNITVESENENLTDNLIFEYNSEKPYYGKGTCGENIIWVLDDKGMLEFSGTGDIPNFDSESAAPWYNLRLKIKSVTLGKDVTGIGDRAFCDCDNIANVTLPESIKRVGSYIFDNSDAFEKIEILGYSVEIADNAFSNSPNIVLYCKSGSTVQSYAELNNIMYVLIDGPTAGFAVKNNQLVAYNGNSANPKIPSGVDSIGANAFKDNSTVTNLELPTSVTSIFSGAFADCSVLEEIFIPHTVTTIAADAFNGTNLKIVCYANSTAHQFAIDNGIEFELVKVNLNNTSLVLKVGEYSIITATPEQEYIESVEMSWKSSDTSIATVDENGKVTANNSGEVTIFALAPNGSTLATCSVNVIPAEAVKEDVVKKPTQTTISYGDAIILHVDASKVPAGGRVEWTASNGNFSYSASGTTCEIRPEKSGDTTFTATIYDAQGNAVSTDEQTMTSKAGFFDKIIAFFKKLFGATKVISQAFKGIY